MTKLDLYRRRSEALQTARFYFLNKGLLEVDCPSLVLYPPIDSNIDVMEVFPFEGKTFYLHTSPEYGMKKLLASGSPDIFYLGHVFRKGEKGERHLPEFTMAEWYRLNFSFEDMIDETADFLRLFLGKLPLEVISYNNLFRTYLGFDPDKVSKQDLLNTAARYISSPSWSKEELLQLLLSHDIEPHLGKNGIAAIIDYPPHEAALAQTATKDGKIVAKRFELYHRGVELANGYLESPNSDELKKRFEETNQQRILAKKAPYLIDESFLLAVANLPPCCGVSVGFDRLFMLSQNLPSIASATFSSLSQ